MFFISLVGLVNKGTQIGRSRAGGLTTYITPLSSKCGIPILLIIIVKEASKEILLNRRKNVAWFKSSLVILKKL